MLAGSPPPEILWYKESSITNSALRSSQQSPQLPLEANLIVGRNKDEPTQSVLTIIPTKEDDASAYRCTVHNRALGQHQKHEKSTKIFVSCKYYFHSGLKIGGKYCLPPPKKKRIEIDLFWMAIHSL